MQLRNRRTLKIRSKNSLLLKSSISYLDLAHRSNPQLFLSKILNLFKRRLNQNQKVLLNQKLFRNQLKQSVQEEELQKINYW